jgi:hypothetical protein
MCVSINKWGFKIDSTLHLGFVRERAKVPLIVSNVSAGNMLRASCGLSGPELQRFYREIWRKKAAGKT